MVRGTNKVDLGSNPKLSCCLIPVSASKRCELQKIEDDGYDGRLTSVGYSSQLPQIARLSGAQNFFTQKLSWNNT
jgi:hypothetical protein